MMDIGQIFDMLRQSGFYQYILPFLLVFILVYMLLSIIFNNNQKLNGIISLILAIFITAQPGFIAWFSSFTSGMLGYVVTIIVLLLFVYMLYAMLTGEKVSSILSKDRAKWIALALVVLLVLLFLKGVNPEGLPPGIRDVITKFRGGGSINFSSPSLWITLIILGLVIAVFWAIFKGGGTKSSQIKSP